MSDPNLNLPIKSSFDATGTDAALRALRQLQQEQGKAQPRSGGDQAAAQAAVAQQRLATETARTAQVTNQAAVASQRLATEEQRTAAAAQQAAAAQSRAEVAALRLAKAQEQAATASQRGATFAQQLGAAYTSSLTSIIGPAAIATASLTALNQAGELVKLGAQAEQTRGAFNNLATAAGTTGNALLTALRSASGGTISDLNLQLAANRAQLLGVADSAAEFSTLMEIARDRAQQMGISTTQAFNDLVTGLGRGSALILDNLGITVSVAEANEAYAESLGKTVSQLTEAEQKQALINAVLAQGQASLEATGGAAETTASKLEKASAAIENAQAALGGLLALNVAPLAEDVANLANALAGVGDTTAGLESAASLSSSIASTMGSAFNPLIATISEYNNFVLSGAASLVEWSGVTQVATAATDQQTAAVQFGTAAMDAAIASQVAANVVTAEGSVILVENAQKSLDAALEAERLAQFQATLADLGSAVQNGLMTSANAASILAAQYGIATSEALRLIAAQAALGQAKVNAAALADQRAGERSGGAFRTVDEVNRVTAAERRRAQEAQRAAEAQRQADMALARAKGDQVGQIALLRQQQQGLNQSSAEYKNIEAQIIGLERQRAGGRGSGGRAGGGVSPRVSAAEQTASRLQDIERAGGDKIAEINEQTQAKLAAIEAKYAEQRAAAQRRLMDEIARTNASTNFDQQLNDFDRFAKDMNDEQRAALADREQAEQEYNQKVAAAQEDARKMAAEGDAELAQEILEARTKQAEQEKQIAEKAAAARRAGGDADEVAREAQEATDAARQQAETEIAIAQAKAQERAQAEQAEKDAVIAQAEEQRAKVVAAAEDQAAKVKGASESQKNAVVSSLRAQADAANAWASAIASAANRAQSAMEGVTGPPTGEEGGGEAGAVAGGGAGGASLAGRGQGLGRSASAASGGADILATIQEVVTFLAVLLPAIAAQTKLVREILRYQHTLQSTIDIIGQIVNIRKALSQPIPALQADAIVQMARDAKFITETIAQHIDPYAARNKALFDHILAADRAAIAVLREIADLRGELQGVTPLPIDRALVQKLANEATAVVEIVKSQILTANRAQSKALEEWAKVTSQSVSIIKDVADLADDLAKVQPPIPHGSIRRLAELAAQTTRVVHALLVPVGEEQAQAIAHYAESAMAAVQLLKETAELPKILAEPQPAIPFGSIRKLAEIAKQVLAVVSAVMIPTAEETAVAMERYTSAAGSAISLIKDAADLPKVLAEARPAIPIGSIKAIAADAKRVTQVVLGEMLPTSEEQAEAAKRYADTTGAAVATLKSTLELPAKLFTDYQSPSDAQINRVVQDANRIVSRVNAAAATYKTDGLEATKAFGEATGSVLAAFKDQLLFAQALNSGDFIVNDRNLAIFEQGMGKTIAVASRLGAQAAAIPAANLAALQAVADANSAAYESLIKLAAVPFGNVGQLAGNYGALGGTTAITVNIYNPPAQMNVAAVTQQVSSALRQQLTARR